MSHMPAECSVYANSASDHVPLQSIQSAAAGTKTVPFPFFFPRSNHCLLRSEKRGGKKAKTAFSAYPAPPERVLERDSPSWTITIVVSRKKNPTLSSFNKLCSCLYKDFSP